MKAQLSKFALLGLVAALATPQSVHAADWIESVNLQASGIDVVPVEVRSNGSEYTSIKTNNHRFSFKMRARAKSGKRIVAAALGTSSAVNFFEAADPGEWIRRFQGRDVANGSLRTWELEHSANIPVAKLNWVGQTPVQRCNALLANKRGQGSSRFSVLNQVQTTSAKAYFKLNAVAARKNKAKNNSWSIGSATDQSHSMQYTVYVKCLPSSTMSDKITN